MGLATEGRIGSSAEKSSTSGAVTNGTAAAAFAAAAGFKNFVQMVIISTVGTIAAAVRATVTYTYGGVAQTIGVGVSATPGAIVLNFGSHPIEGDDNTAITVSMPALGASGIGEATLIGLVRAS